MDNLDYRGDLSPTEAWALLSSDPKAMLVDVRTPAEWSYVGVPDLSDLGKRPLFVPWVGFPDMQMNPDFTAHVEQSIPDRTAPLLFLCRSGARSRAAAIAMTHCGYASCYNVATGFEGNQDRQRHRGTVDGWKVADLPWVQG
jgi:rhodanese-related sulfurtransferase